MTLTAVVVDDEPLSRDELSYLLARTGRVKVLAEAGSGPEALEAVERWRPDLLFLDVQMPEMSGFDVAKALARREPVPAVVFATAYDDYALEAFEASAFDYLLKPFDPGRINKVVERLERLLKGSQGLPLDRLESFLARVSERRTLHRLPLERNGRIVLVAPGDVLYASSGEGGTLVCTGGGDEYRTPLSLQDLESRLPESFVRVHRQYLVNLERVTEFIPWPGGTASLVLDDRARTQVPVARTQVRRIKELLGIEGVSAK